ncbi:hypothetical protein BDN70DRAFT_925944 [Pholiota conissans]|uniref:Uncharacterized protein n=1 Tax=Pholiota conissans TaxID=109636 RepID=A0A9P5YN67_9AGAR|nr:hypothetical protein BDN70DRAFT_925944 [Pholiota conissans]
MDGRRRLMEDNSQTRDNGWMRIEDRCGWAGDGRRTGDKDRRGWTRRVMDCDIQQRTIAYDQQRTTDEVHKRSTTTTMDHIGGRRSPTTDDERRVADEWGWWTKANVSDDGPARMVGGRMKKSGRWGGRARRREVVVRVRMALREWKGEHGWEDEYYTICAFMASISSIKYIFAIKLREIAKKKRDLRQCYFWNVIQRLPATSTPPPPPAPPQMGLIIPIIFLPIFPAFSAPKIPAHRTLQPKRGPEHHLLRCLYMLGNILDPRCALAALHSERTTPPLLPAPPAG